MSDQNDVKSEESDTFSKKMVDYKGSSIANSQDSVLAAGCTKQVAKQKSMSMEKNNYPFDLKEPSRKRTGELVLMD